MTLITPEANSEIMVSVFLPIALSTALFGLIAIVAGRLVLKFSTRS